jgi:hypothetical protein
MHQVHDTTYDTAIMSSLKPQLMIDLYQRRGNKGTGQTLGTKHKHLAK